MNLSKRQSQILSFLNENQQTTIKLISEQLEVTAQTIKSELIGITEGAIPFASADPKRALPSIVVGSAVAGACGMIFKITDVVPHGGPIVGVLGATNNI